MDDFTAVMIAEGVEEGVEEGDYEAAWQHLIDTGLVWKLQGWFGREATRLIEAGVCHPRHKDNEARGVNAVPHKDWSTDK